MSGRGHLLDCNTLSAYFDEVDTVVKRARRVPSESFGHISIITLGEIEFGHRRNSTTNQAVREEFEQFIEEKFPWIVCLSRDTPEYYGAIRAELFRSHGPQSATSKQNRVEQLCDRVTGHSLGIDENDLWLAAQAVERAMVLVSNDRMPRIRDAALAAGYRLNYENWREPL
jgi:tRNA(fMet)-specific endonuclease VapC